jgi:hypothetical protein
MFLHAHLEIEIKLKYIYVYSCPGKYMIERCIRKKCNRQMRALREIANKKFKEFIMLIFYVKKHLQKAKGNLINFT